MEHFDAQGVALAIAALLGVMLVALAGGRVAWRAWMRRRREALREAGLQLAFDACAPEGADLSLEPFRLGRLRGDSFDDYRRP